MRLKALSSAGLGRTKPIVFALIFSSALSLLPELPAHAGQSLTLAWNPSLSPTVAGYNIYYGPASGSYTNMVTVGNVTNGVLSGLVTGQTYYIAATSYDNSGNQSPFSEEISNTIPFMTPVITTLPVASGITYGQTLASSVLSGGTASTPGSFAFTTPSLALNAGTANVSVTFTPTDANDFTPASATVSVAVSQAAATVTLTNLNQTYDGTAKSVIASTTPTNLAVNVTYNGFTNAPVQAGQYTVAAIISDANYSGGATNTLTINPATPVITTLPVVGPITFGQTLASSALSGGMASTPGSFAFTTPSLAPNAGTANVSVTFIPTDANDFTPASATVNVAVSQAAATVTLTNLNQTYDGTAKSVIVSTTPTNLVVNVTYNGSTNAPVQAGQYTVAAIILDANHSGGTTNAFTINPATPVITTLPVASGITYGQTLASSALSGGMASTPGSFAFTTPSLAPNAGTANVSVTFIPTDANDFTPASATVNVAVSQSAATITLTNLNQTYDGTAKSVIVSTTPTNLVVNVTYNGSTNAPVQAGLYTVAAIILDANHSGGATNTFTINPATPVITTPPVAVPITFGQTLASSVLSGGMASTPGSFAFTTPSLAPNAGTANESVTFTPTDGNDFTPASATVNVAVSQSAATVTLTNLNQTYDGTAKSVIVSTTPTNLVVNVTYNGSTNAPVQAGQYTVAATIVAANYSGGVTNTLTINPATPVITTLPVASGITYGQTLASSALSGGMASTPGSFAFTTPSLAPNAGTANVSVTFTPTDANDFTPASATVNVAVSQAAATVTLTNLNQTYDGTAKSVIVSTTPTNLVVNVTYNGATNAPVQAGQYTVAATIVAANYSGGATNTLTINPATPVITTLPVASGITYGQTLASSALSGGTASAPGSFAFTTPSLAPNAGTANVSVTFIPTDANDFTPASATVNVAVSQAAATVTLTNLNQTYDGTAKSVIASTTPTNLAVNVTYNGFTNAPVQAGQYTVAAIILDANHSGGTTNSSPSTRPPR